MRKFLLFLITVFLAYLTAYQTTGKKNGFTSPFDFSWAEDLMPDFSNYEYEDVAADSPYEAQINEYFRQGYDDYEQGKFDRALDGFFKAAEDPEVAVEAYIMIGRSYVGLKDTERALESFETALSLNPDSYDALYQRGLLYFEADDFESAKNDFLAAESYGKEGPQIMYYLSYCFEKTGDYKSALETAIESVARDETYYSGLFQAGRMYFANELYQEAADIYDKILEQNSEDKYSILNRALSYDRLDMTELALEGYSHAVLIDSDYALAYNNRGYLLARTGDTLSALQDYNKALELENHFELTLWNRAGLYYGMADYQKAMNDYLFLYEINKKNYSALYNVGLCFEYLGEPQKAVAYYQSYLESDSQDMSLKDRARNKIQNLQ